MKRKPWDSNPQAAYLPPPVFQAGSSTVRMASVIKLRRLESNQHEDVQSVSSYRWMTPHRFVHRDTLVSTQVRGGGVEPPSPGSKPGSLPLADPRSRSKSALRESNPPRQLGRLDASAARPRAHKAEGEGVEPSRLIARPLSGRLPSPVGLTFRIARLRWQESNLRMTSVNRRLPVPTQAPPQSKSGRRDLNPRSRAPEARGIPGFPTSCIKSAQRELNPHFRHGKADRLPLHHGRVNGVPNCQTTRAPGGTRTHVAALRVRYPRRWTTSAYLSVGSEGLEPSPGGLRVRCAAASTLIPCSVHSHAQSARRESNPRPGPYKRPALTTELRAAVGPKGLEPLLAGLKVRCAAVTPRPRNAGRAYAFPSCLLHASCSSFPVVALRVELSTTRLSAVFGQPALDYHVPTSSSRQSGWQDSNLRLRAPTQRTAGFAATLHPVVQSERPDLNRRSPGPRPGAIPRLRYVLPSSSSCGSRTRLFGLKGPMSSTDRRTSHRRRAPSTQMNHGFCAHLSRSGSGGARIRVCGFSGQAATPSQLPTQQKKPDVVCDTGLWVFFGNGYGLMSQAHWIGRDSIRRLIGECTRPLFALCNSAVWKSWLFLSRSSGSPPRAAYMYSIV